MFKIFKKKSTVVTVQVEDLEVGDQFVYNTVPVTVKSIIDRGDCYSDVYCDTTLPNPNSSSVTVLLPNELLIAVIRKRSEA